MSDDGQQDDSRLRALQRELQLNRRRMLVGLADSWSGVANTLADTYARVELLILERLRDLKPDDDPAVLLARLGEVQGDFEILARALNEGRDGFLQSGLEGGARVGVANLRAGGMRVAWGVVEREQILAGIDLVDDVAWRAMIGRYAPYHTQRVRDVVLDAISRGRNPRETAKDLAQWLAESKSALTDAERIARTTQLYAARRGTNAVYVGNGVNRWMWAANIGNPRTCLACISLHGTIHPSSEVLNDHWLGRCAPLPMTPLWSDLGLDGADDNPVSGVTWFNQQTEDEQRRVMGAELYDFWRAGLFEFGEQAVVGVDVHPVFGEMRHRRPNYEIAGLDKMTARDVLRQVRRGTLFGN